MRVVLDTNVVISGIFFGGLPSQILTAWIDDAFDLVVSTDVLEEYRYVAGRISEKFPGVEIGPVLDRIASHALLVVPVDLPGDACTDRNDIGGLMRSSHQRGKTLLKVSSIQVFVGAAR